MKEEYRAQRQASARLSVEADAKELRAAALNGDLRKVEAQLAAGVDVDGRAGDGQVRAMIGSGYFVTRTESVTEILLQFYAFHVRF